ncbi:MAG: hypothetical protein V4599_12055 [Verrucomicrobiota bacterium]
MLGLFARLAAALALVILIAVIINLGIHKLERSPPVQPEYEAAQKAPEPAEVKAVAVAPAGPVQGIERLEEKRPQIETALRAFFKAATVEDKLAFARSPDRVRPLVHGYYSQRPFQARTLTGLGTCQSVAEKGYRLGYIQALFAKETPLSVIVEEQADGQFRVDWESLVRYGEMEWETFLREKPTRPILLRVIASLPAGGGEGDGEWLEVRSPGQEPALKARFDRQNPALKPLIDQLQLGGWKNVPLTLRVCYSESKSNADTAQIVSCEGKGWLILN